ncbi:chorismate mutase [Sulfurimonas sp. MAG313]|nr:chorismate mutase [Sulfurimonas sp. MAG313]MDF1881545.1 chorismate mutase [Sulfurimonas sp. MAG313]
MKDCNDLNEVRIEIDKLDDEIVALIAKRNAYIHQAVKFKQSVEEVKAADRIEQVIRNVRTKAITLNMSANMIEDLYTNLIDAMVESEIAEFRDKGAF